MRTYLRFYVKSEAMSKRFSDISKRLYVLNIYKNQALDDKLDTL
jgi:hypothetical protein